MQQAEGFVRRDASLATECVERDQEGATNDVDARML
jgi:hypothetical protein